jgi:hypothetical protein
VDIVYTYRHNPVEFMRWPTLLHSLASVRRYGLGFDRVFVASTINPLVLGAECEWVQVIEAEPADCFEKERNIWAALLKVIDTVDLSDELLWLTDDSFAVSAFDAEALRVPRYDGLLRDVPPLLASLWPLIHPVSSAFPEGKNFACHTPVVFRKSELITTWNRFGPLQIESSVFNAFRKEGVPDDALCVRITAENPIELAAMQRIDKTAFFNISEGTVSNRLIEYLLWAIYG